MDSPPLSTVPPVPVVFSLPELLADVAPDPLPTAVALEVLGAVADALAPAYRRGKGVGLGPETVTFDPEGRAGLGGPASRDPLFRAPELDAGDAPTPDSDAYAFAVLSVHLLTGRRPRFSATTPIAVLDDHPDFPATPAEALTRALGSDRSRRSSPAVLAALFSAVPADEWPVPGAQEVDPAPWLQDGPLAASPIGPPAAAPDVTGPDAEEIADETPNETPDVRVHQPAAAAGADLEQTSPRSPDAFSSSFRPPAEVPEIEGLSEFLPEAPDHATRTAPRRGAFGLPRRRR